MANDKQTLLWWQIVEIDIQKNFVHEEENSARKKIQIHQKFPIKDFELSN